MPRGDGTGPIGQGSMTGRGLGNCLKYGIPIITGIATALGWGRRRGQRHGLRYQPQTKQNEVANQKIELEELKEQAKIMENSLEEIKNKITELEKK